MNEYFIREASFSDLSFISTVVVLAEKSNSDKLSFSTLFNLSENKVKELIVSMFEEEIEGCEFDLKNYLVVEYEGEAVAAFGSWIEGYNGNMPSKILKSNLIGHTFGRECVEFLRTKSLIIKDILAEREGLALQFEYLFVSEKHRGKKLANLLIQKLEERALKGYPELKKAQVQVYKNNIQAIKVYENCGFKIAKSFASTHPEVMDYLPFNEKYIMEKNYLK